MIMASGTFYYFLKLLVLVSVLQVFSQLQRLLDPGGWF